MDRLNLCFINILRSALSGEPLQLSADLTQEEWHRLMDLAKQHHVLPIVFQAVHDLPALKGAAFLPPLKQQVRQQVLMQAQKTYDFLRLMEDLHAAGLHPLVVKGIICRDLYPHPDHRISADEDLLISEAELLPCHKALTGHGFFTSVAEKSLVQSYEIPYRAEAGHLYLELHRHLFPPESKAYGDLNRFFDGVFHRAVTQKIQGISVYTLSCTDHLLYLLCHAFKHFLHSGFGIRQVCDIVMYANAYGARIDWQTILESCRAIRADLFAAAVFRIGQNYLVFDPEQACYPPAWQSIPVDEFPLLEDLLCGGIYGNASMSRKHSSSITLDAVAARKQGKKRGNALMLSLFPSAKDLEGKYPYLKGHPYLLPAAWFHRICEYGKETKTTRNNKASEALKIGSQRIALLKKYGIIE